MKPVTDDIILWRYGRMIWEQCEQERARIHRDLESGIEAIIEASGAAEYDWKNGHGIEEYCKEVLTGTALEAALSRWAKHEEISEYYRQIHELTYERKRKG